MALDDSLALAEAHLDGGRPRDALRSISVALASTPDDTQAMGLFVRAQLELENWAAALAAAQRLVTLAPDETGPLILLALSYAGTANWTDALSAGRTVITLDPHAWQGFTLLAHLQVNAKTVTDETFELAREAIRLAPDLAEPHVELGNVWLAKRKWAKAEDCYRTALRIDPSDLEARNNLALVASRRGDAGSSAAALIEMLAENPQSEVALFNLRQVAARGLQILHLTIWGTAIIGWSPLNSTVGRLLGDNATVIAGPLRAILAVAVTVAIALYVLWVRSRAGAQFPIFLRSIPALDRPLVVWAVILVPAYLLVVAVPFAPIGWAGALYGSAFVTLAVGTIVSHRRAKALAGSGAS